MMRLIALAAAAAAVALPAMAEPSIRVSTAGKSTEQVRAEVRRAAMTLCERASQGATAPVEAKRVCVKHAVNAAFAGSGLPQPTTLAKR